MNYFLVKTLTKLSIFAQQKCLQKKLKNESSNLKISSIFIGKPVMLKQLSANFRLKNKIEIIVNLCNIKFLKKR